MSKYFEFTGSSARDGQREFFYAISENSDDAISALSWRFGDDFQINRTPDVEREPTQAERAECDLYGVRGVWHR